MPPSGARRIEIARLLWGDAWIVPRGCFPVLYYVPVGLQRWLRRDIMKKSRTQASKVEELVQIVGVGVVHQLLIWEIVLLELSSNTSLQSALYRVPRKIVRTWRSTGAQ